MRIERSPNSLTLVLDRRAGLFDALAPLLTTPSC